MFHLPVHRREDIEEQLPERADWPRLIYLKRHWQVSLAALLMRARVLGRMSDADYLSAVKATSARDWRRVEPVPLGRPEKPQLLKRLLDSPSGIIVGAPAPQDFVEALATALAA
jgi:Zn-dependent peptidase ImmA (M78 family)